MARVHLLELEDQPWFPAVIRDAATAFLRFAGERSGHADALAPALRDVLDRAGVSHVVDLCSGGAGPLARIVDVLRAQGTAVTATLTDLYPNTDALARAHRDAAGAVRFEVSPVDARRVPRHLTGLRTLFNAFHHFAPDDARAVLQDAVDAGQPIALYEFVRRSPVALAGMAIPFAASFATVPLLRPFRWAWLPLTWGVPAVPLTVLFDGVVSCLRVYDPDELRALTASLRADGWTWDIGELPIPCSPVPVTYLVGLPPASASR